MHTSTSTDYPWHEASWQKIVSARSQNHLPHALLLSGSKGTGRLDFAEKLVTSLLCTSPVDETSCGNCQSCKTYHSSANPDFLRVELLEGKQQISVDQVRKISEFISYTRSFDAYRVVLISPAERMNLNSANSLLKSLEEPASNTVIILVTTHLGKMLPTIKSRCQLLTLPTPETKQAVSWLQDMLPMINNPEELLNMAHGQPLTAMNISDDALQNRADVVDDLIALCSEKKTITEIAKEWEKNDQTMLLNWQITWLQDIIKNNAIDDQNTQAQTENINKISEKLIKIVNPEKQWQLYQQLINQRKTIHTSVNSLLFVENMLILWLQASHTAKYIK